MGWTPGAKTVNRRHVPYNRELVQRFSRRVPKLARYDVAVVDVNAVARIHYWHGNGCVRDMTDRFCRSVAWVPGVQDVIFCFDSPGLYTAQRRAFLATRHKPDTRALKPGEVMVNGKIAKVGSMPATAVEAASLTATDPPPTGYDRLWSSGSGKAALLTLIVAEVVRWCNVNARPGVTYTCETDDGRHLVDGCEYDRLHNFGEADHKLAHAVTRHRGRRTLAITNDWDAVIQGFALEYGPKVDVCLGRNYVDRTTATVYTTHQQRRGRPAETVYELVTPGLAGVRGRDRAVAYMLIGKVDTTYADARRHGFPNTTLEGLARNPPPWCEMTDAGFVLKTARVTRALRAGTTTLSPARQATLKRRHAVPGSAAAFGDLLGHIAWTVGYMALFGGQNAAGGPAEPAGVIFPGCNTLNDALLHGGNDVLVSMDASNVAPVAGSSGQGDGNG